MDTIPQGPPVLEVKSCRDPPGKGGKSGSQGHVGGETRPAVSRPMPSGIQKDEFDLSSLMFVVVVVVSSQGDAVIESLSSAQMIRRNILGKVQKIVIEPRSFGFLGSFFTGIVGSKVVVIPGPKDTVFRFKLLVANGGVVLHVVKELFHVGHIGQLALCGVYGVSHPHK
eukprot:scaffold2500_cov176-Amphora_coffeaeformis.AAC.3